MWGGVITRKTYLTFTNLDDWYKEHIGHILGMWNGEMVSLSSVLVTLSSGTFPFSISTFPSVTCVSTPLAAWNNFWRFQKRLTK